jgi:EAL domain-containing protein (putative c-di-GMP-specific phosphodiesterase class I)
MALVCDVLEQTNFPANHLELEITERGLLEGRDTEAIIDVLNDLHSLGVRLAIDNFGTGYSSLAYLKRFPVDTLKIDRSFISTISNVQEDTGIASTIIAMAHSLGFKVLAEGVETNEQLDFLRAKECDFYQGYIKSEPVPAAEFAILLREQAGIQS